VVIVTEMQIETTQLHISLGRNGEQVESSNVAGRSAT
jgi:hypothetical protein